jgi:hypothetical protein
MWKIFLYVISCTLIFGCNQIKAPKTGNIEQIQNEIEAIDTLKIGKAENFVFQFNNNNYKSLGIETFEHDLPVGPCDVLLTDSSFIILDQYHNNLKNYSINGQLIEASIPLSNNRIWLKQLAKIEDRILVISELDSLYIFSDNLELLKRKFFETKNGRIYKVESDKIVLYFPLQNHKFLEINDQGEIIGKKFGLEHKTTYKSHIEYFENGFRINEEFYFTDSLDLREYFHDINKNTVVYYGIESDIFKINVLYFNEVKR